MKQTQLSTTAQINAAQKQAFSNIAKSIDFNCYLPNNVFIGGWNVFLFCESDRIFGQEFIIALKLFLSIEESCVSCLFNIDRAKANEFNESSVIFIDGNVTENSYREALRSGGPANGWLYGVDRYACASDAGQWCMYCEKDNDIAIIGLHTSTDIEKFKNPLDCLRAKTIKNLVADGKKSPYPFGDLAPVWREGLLNNYGK